MNICEFKSSGVVRENRAYVTCSKCGRSRWIDRQRSPTEYKRLCRMDGAGSELSRMLGAIGIPSCQRCQQTAVKMNRMGVLWTRSHIDVLVDEISSNAKLHDNLSVRAMSKLIPQSAKSTMIRSLILKACDVYETSEKQEVPAGRDAD